MGGQGLCALVPLNSIKYKGDETNDIHPGPWGPREDKEGFHVTLDIGSRITINLGYTSRMASISQSLTRSCGEGQLRGSTCPSLPSRLWNPCLQSMGSA